MVRSAFVKVAFAVPKVSRPLLLTKTVVLATPERERKLVGSTRWRRPRSSPVITVPVPLMSSNTGATQRPCSLRSP